MVPAAASPITRRSILTGAATVAAASAIAVPALAGHPDADLFALAEKINAVSERSAAACKAFTAAQEAMYDWEERNLRPVEPTVRRHADDDDADRRAASREYSAALPRWVVELRDWEVRHAAAELECRFDEREAAWSDAILEIGDFCEAVIAIPATTIEGLKCKASLHEHDESMANSIVADLLELNTH